ncbi:PEPxxWA-CTERM sorting domain-containing protein [Sphingomonas changnyeongensis]|uniref:PEPxxWA-CTERM sorting domain-containing protein n=2 Tax=Sphingomonas changnyeongensis TaxID=2698679 RepID=A0A7Z2NYJ4_9SPHN|nr:PEPxxWA-CTERM sorting domain-containing protein [Sphingomonas changnyeongensis]
MTVHSAAQAEVVIQRWPAAGFRPADTEFFFDNPSLFSGDSQIGQTYTAEYTGKLLSVDLLLTRGFIPNGPDPEFELSLFDRPGGSRLTKTTFTAPADLGPSFRWVSVDVSSANIFLTTGAKGFIVWNEAGLIPGLGRNQTIDWVGLYGPSESLYAGGKAFKKLSQNPNWERTRKLSVDDFTKNDVDLAFRLHIDTSFAAIPEPATWAMMIGGFGLTGMTLRRRNGTSVRCA